MIALSGLIQTCEEKKFYWLLFVVALKMGVSFSNQKLTILYFTNIDGVMTFNNKKIRKNSIFFSIFYKMILNSSLKSVLNKCNLAHIF